MYICIHVNNFFVDTRWRDHLMIMQVTYFQCGGVSLGIGMEHRVMDRDSAFHFLKAWSEIARGLDVTLEPILDRKILKLRHPPQLISNHTEYFTQAMKPSHDQQQINTTDESDQLSSSIKVVFLKVTSSQLKMLKAKAGKEGSAVNYSTFEILAGHIWKCACVACKLPVDEETKVFFPVNGRTRLQPPIPHGDFGNVVFKGRSSSSPGDLQSKQLWFAASRIHQGLATLSNDYLRSVIDYLNLNPGTKLCGANDHKYRKFLFTSWLRLPVHDADFGWGKPFYMGPGGSSLSEGRAFIFPNGAKDGSLSVIIALQHEHIKVFEKLFYEPMNSFGQSNL